MNSFAHSRNSRSIFMTELTVNCPLHILMSSSTAAVTVILFELEKWPPLPSYFTVLKKIMKIDKAYASL